MLIILASRHDAAAQQLAARWQAQDAQEVQVLTCADMSLDGWRYYVQAPRPSTLVVGGREIAQSEVRGVLTRLPYIYAEELTVIAPADRAYVATEMTAFLTCWLSSLTSQTIPVLNAPTASSLAGPNWRHEQWVHAAARLGMNVRPLRRQVRYTGETPPAEAELTSATTAVTLVGKRLLGTVDEQLAHFTRRLAEVASVALLTAHFSGPKADARFLHASTWPDITQPEIADALLEYFLAVGTASARPGWSASISRARTR
jgi:hypothetical protein